MYKRQDLYTSWVKGEYIFKDAALEEIFNKLLHWYDFTVRYQNEQLKDKRFSLVIDRKISLEQLLELISFTDVYKRQIIYFTGYVLRKNRPVY